MKFFKIIDIEKNIILKVVRDTDIICMKKTLGGQFIATKKLFSSDDYAICVDNIIYIVDGKDFDDAQYKKVSLVMLSLSEFNALSQVLQESIKNDEENLIEDVELYKDTSTLDTIISMKIYALKLECSKNITAGIDIHYSETLTKHFDLTIEDQLNLQNIKYLISQGETQFAYHSKGEPFRYYSKEEMQLIIDAANRHILYHNSYFNSLRDYINSLENIKEVDSIYYGQDFPHGYKSEVLLALMESKN